MEDIKQLFVVENENNIIVKLLYREIKFEYHENTLHQ